MPVVDRRSFGGRFSVQENSRRLANCRYLAIELMEMLAGWSHTTPQLAFKATFGYHVYDHADAPTVRLLRHLGSIDQSHVAWGQAVLDSLTNTPEARKQALAVQAEVEARLLACGGVTGQGIESHWLTFHRAREEAKPPQRTSRGLAQGYRFVKQSPPLDHPVVEAPFWFAPDRVALHAAYHSDDPWSIEGYRHKFHQLLYGEVETTDRMGKLIAEHPELPQRPGRKRKQHK